MTDLQHPWWLLAFILLAAVVALYVWMQRQRHRRTLLFGNFAALDAVAPRPRRIARHIPVVAMIVALALLTIAMAVPQADRKVPRNRATVVLVIDVSNSMQATDVAPSRLAAAKEAAKKFADDLTSGINLGLISYAGTPQVLVSPTPDHSRTKAAVDGLKLADKTATGEGIFAALDQIKTLNGVLGGPTGAPPARIVLESDGKETVPSNPDNTRGAFTAARKAREDKIPVNTISFGTSTGTVEIDGQRIPVPVDNDSLRKIASLSNGEFFTATSLDELKKVYDTLQQQIGYETQKGDASHIWVVLGTLLAAVAVLAAIGLNRRLP